MKGESCAKLILFGEHAAVYGKPAIAIPVKELKTIVTLADSDRTQITSSQDLTEEQVNRMNLLVNFLKIRLEIKKQYSINVESNIPISIGYGSSASLSIALIRAFSRHEHLELDDEKINSLAFESEKIFHGRPSGIDNTVIVYERPIFYHDRQAELFLPSGHLSFVVADSGPRPPTKEVVEQVRLRYESEPADTEKIISEIASLTSEAKGAISDCDLSRIGKLMNRNQELLQKLGVSTSKLDEMCKAALAAGAYGAKLSGAGKGGNIIALVDESSKEKVKVALSKHSAFIIGSAI